MALPRELVQLVHETTLLNQKIRALNHVVSVKELTRAYAELSDGANTQQRLREWPVVVKDVFCTTTEPTTASSRMLERFTSPFDATVVSRLRRAGALILGKANMDEFGMGSENKNSIFGSVVNPAKLNTTSDQASAKLRSAGGSSGGSAAAVASGMCRIALGSDTGGSTRLPAAYCGVVGLKPSYGLLSRFGMITYASSLDCVGIMAKRVADIRTTYKVLSAFDERDPTSVPQDVRDTLADRMETLPIQANGNDLTGLRIGVPQQFFPSELSTSVLSSLRKALQLLVDRGAQVFSVTLPSTPLALSAYYVLASAEASSNLARYDGIRYGHRDLESEQIGERTQLYARTRSQGFGREVQKRILLGTFALSAEAFDNYFLRAQKVRQQIRQEFDDVFRYKSILTSQTFDDNLNGVDVLVYPSAISTAPNLVESAQTPDSTSSEKPTKQIQSTNSYVQDVLNTPASLAGLPAISVPVGGGEADGWPVGVQIAAQWGDDELVLRVAESLQDAVAI
ncbi:Trimeric GatFAB AmidoTransferase(AdT) complex subunit [Microbotryomycetes sp. JL221]|nr:Trimeric GatFAB AmidoTransferase(AdT) complex subunit [Microbotryomycetes sp. JL221]